MSIKTEINPILSSVLKRGVIKDVKDIKEPDFVAKDMRSTLEKVKEIAWAVFTWVIFPLALLHYLAGLVVLPASCWKSIPEWLEGDRTKAQEGTLKTSDLSGPVSWSKYYDCKRVSFKTADGVRLDGLALVRKEKTNRWAVAFNPNAGAYEGLIANQLIGIDALSTQFESNILLFNYRGTGHSQNAWASREGLIRDGEAALQFVEAMGAKEIITYGLSLGGGVSVKALTKHKKKEGITYLSINERSFSKLSLVAKNIVNHIVGRPIGWVAKWLIRITGWEMDVQKEINSLETRCIVVYHNQDRLMAGSAGLGHVLKKQSYEDLVAFGDEQGELDFCWHSPQENVATRMKFYQKVRDALEDKESV